ncbi:MAG: undecaprenyl-phosphate glucose phosphotransferase [Kiritimatiellia bacterium]
MRQKDTIDVLNSVLAVLLDAFAVMAGILAATWIRFDSGWVAVPRGRPADLYRLYGIGGFAAIIVFLLVFRALGLFARPQTGSFVNKIPRIVKGIVIGELLSTVLAFAVQNEIEFSRGVILITFFTAAPFVLIERYVLFRIEWNLARHSPKTNNVLILGTDSVAAHLKHSLEREPTLRARIAGFVRTDLSEPEDEIPRDMILGTVEELGSVISEHRVDQVILVNSSPGREKIVDIILMCERNLIAFNMVPDLFRVMTSTMDVQSLNDIPLLGLSRWPLDYFWNRLLKRAEDITGSAVGLLLAGPVIALAAVAVKAVSPGPVFYKQERCGEGGKTFTLYKLRTMPVDAEADTGPVWTVENDPRRTRLGALLRRLNLDELPQLWNVLKGEMSLVGPRPERPHFVEQFKENIMHYMQRHVSKPGMTGWAQINGLRGNTSISERLKYDLYYLENWSLAFDFKILLRTFFANRNAY